MELKDTHKGMATIELLIAFAFIVLVLTAVIVVVFGNQSIVLDAQLNNLALYKAEEKLENAFDQSRQDFDDIDDASSIDGIFSLSTEVDGDDDDCYKLVRSTASWWETSLRPQDLNLATWFANPSAVEVHAGDCPTSPLGNPFDDPNAFREIDIGGEPSTGIDVLAGYVYMTANANAAGKSDIYVYAIDDLVNDVSDDPLDELNTGVGLNRIDVGKFGSNIYAYALNGDFNDIPEIHIVDVTNPADIEHINTVPIPNVVPNCPTYCPPAGEVIRHAIHIHNGYLYVGIHRIGPDPDTMLGGEEFYIYNLADPTLPFFEGALEVNHNIYDIIVSGDYAFLATSDDTGEVLVVDVENKTNPQFAGVGFDADGTDNGKSLALVGDTLYLGRRNAGSDGDLYILDVSDPGDIDDLSGPYDMDLNGANTETRGIIVRETVEDGIVTRLAFLAVNDPNESLFILIVTDPTDIQPVSLCTDGYNTEQKPTGIDMESSGQYVFMSNESQKNLKIIEDENSCS